MSDEQEDKDEPMEKVFEDWFDKQWSELPQSLRERWERDGFGSWDDKTPSQRRSVCKIVDSQSNPAHRKWEEAGFKWQAEERPRLARKRDELDKTETDDTALFKWKEGALQEMDAKLAAGDSLYMDRGDALVDPDRELKDQNGVEKDLVRAGGDDSASQAPIATKAGEKALSRDDELQRDATAAGVRLKAEMKPSRVQKKHVIAELRKSKKWEGLSDPRMIRLILVRWWTSDHA